MLSINVPVYNIDARPLVLKLAELVCNFSTESEILVYDDGSKAAIKELNREFQNRPGIIYHELPKNLGRSAIRNKMAEDSRFEYLLFIDADSEIISDDFLNNYLKSLRNKKVLCGGTVYSSTPPADNSKLLRWVYGSQREAISANERNNKKGFIITSNNFCIEKKLFLETRFREDIGKYGHEDTLLGFDLFKKGMTPFHIDNPVKHTGLEDAEMFLKKTRNAVENLLFISENLLKDDSDFEKQLHFLNRYKKLTSILPEAVLRKYFSIFRNKMEKNLKGKNPRLFYFDLYKLGYFAVIKNRKP
jgi:glycosyltransferase involved in cell wall biosynthesis